MNDDPALERMLQTMALSGWVSPETLCLGELPPAERVDLFRRLLVFCTVGAGAHEGKWRLTDAARRRVFAGWRRVELLQALRGAGHDSIGGILRWVVGTEEGAVEPRTSADLADLRAVQTWLPSKLQSRYLSESELAVRIERTALQEDLEMLAGRRFVGRTLQLRQLRRHVIEGRSEAIVVHGPGGIGKSALLAAFQAELVSIPELPVLRFDFDRPDLDPLISASLDRELVRQVGATFPSIRQECEKALSTMLHFGADQAREIMNLRTEDSRWAHDDDNWLPVSESSMSSLPALVQADRNMESSEELAASEVQRILHLIHPFRGRLVLCVDSFERVQNAGTEAVTHALDWIGGVSASLRWVSTAAIIAGRCHPGPHDLLDGSLDIALGELSPKDAGQLLRSYGCPPAAARVLVKRLPVRSPLVLRLAMEAAGAQAAQLDQLIDDLERDQPQVDLLSGYLYQRVLAHIDKPVVRDYALASLAIPELDQGLLAEVLMPEVEPEAKDDALAAKRWDELANVHWLIERIDGGKLRLRTDVRELVLKIAAGDSKSQALRQRVRSAAQHYHAQFNTDWHQAMALYHDIQDAEDARSAAEILGPLGDLQALGLTDPERMKEHYREQVERFATQLMPYAADLPAALREVLAKRRGDRLDLREARVQFDDTEWRRIMDGDDGFTGRGQDIVARQDPLNAHEMYVARPTQGDGLPPAYALQAACDSARWEELRFDMRRACRQLLARFADSGNPSNSYLHLAALVRFSLFSDPLGPSYDLVHLLEEVLPSCAPVGAAAKVADMFAIAEVFHDRDYLSSRFLQSMRSGPATDRILQLHPQSYASGPRKAQLTLAACVSLSPDEVRSRQAAHDPSVSDETDQLSWLTGQSWSSYLGMFRKLGKSLAAPDIEAPTRIFLPEFYRPLRQALKEAFLHKEEALDEFTGRLAGILPPGPAEFQPARLRHLLESDPHHWFHALVQYADWCGSLSAVADCAFYTSAPGNFRLDLVKERLHLWEHVLANSMREFSRR